MSLNLAGLGFTFGAKDAGLGKAQTKFAEGFRDISTGLFEMRAAAADAFAPIQKKLTPLTKALDKQIARIELFGYALRTHAGSALEYFGNEATFVFSKVTLAAKKVASGAVYIKDAVLSAGRAIGEKFAGYATKGFDKVAVKMRAVGKTLDKALAPVRRAVLVPMEQWSIRQKNRLVALANAAKNTLAPSFAPIGKMWSAATKLILPGLKSMAQGVVEVGGVAVRTLGANAKATETVVSLCASKVESLLTHTSAKIQTDVADATKQTVVITTNEICEGIQTAQESLLEMCGVAAKAVENSRIAEKTADSMGQVDKSVTKLNGTADGVGKKFGKLGVAMTVLGDVWSKVSHRLKKINDSVKAGLREIKEGFGKVKDSVESMNKVLGMNKLSTFVQSVSLSRLNDLKRNMGELTGQSINLTTSLEAEGASASKQAMALVANMGLEGKEAAKFQSKIVGMTMGMRIGADNAAAAMWGWTKQAEELKAIGIKSAEQLAKLSEVTGVSGRELADSMGRMRKEMGMTVEETSQVVKAYGQFGRAAGNVGEGMKELPKIMELMSRKAALLGKTLKPGELAKFARESAGVATSVFAMTKDMGLATSISHKMAESLVESGENLGNMFAGTADELGDFPQELAIIKGDVNEAFKTMREGPAGLIKGLVMMGRSAKKSGLNVTQSFGFVRARLEKLFGKDLAGTLVNYMDKADDSMLAMMDTSKKAAFDFGKLADKGYSSGMTLQESFDKAKDGMIANFRSLGTARQDFVKNAAHDFGKMSKVLKELVAKGGPMGAMVQKMADMHSLGATGLLPKTLQPMAVVFGEMVKTATPLVGMLGSLGFRLHDLFNPLHILVIGFGALALWFADLRMKGKTTAQAIDHMADSIGAFVDKIPDKIAHVIDKLAHVFDHLFEFSKKKMDFSPAVKKMMASIADSFRRVKSQFKEIGRAFWEGLTGQFDPAQAEGKKSTEKVGGYIGYALLTAVTKAKAWFLEKAWPAMKDFVRGIFDGLNGVVLSDGKSKSGEMGQAIGGYIKMAFDYVKDLVKAYFKNWWGRVGDVWKDGNKTFKQKVVATAEESSGLLLAGFAVMKYTPVLKTLSSLTGIMSGLAMTMSSVVSIGAKLLPLLTASGAAAAALYVAIAAVVAGAIAFAVWPEQAQAAVDGVFAKVSAGVTSLVKWCVLHLPDLFTKAIPGLLWGVYKVLQSLRNLMLTVVNSILDGIRDALKEWFPSLSGVIDAVFEEIKWVYVAFVHCLYWFVGVFQLLGKAYDFFFGKAEDGTSVLGKAWQGLKEVFTSVFEAVKPVLSIVWEVGKIVGIALIAPFYALWWITKTVFGFLWDALSWIAKPLIFIGGLIVDSIIFQFKVLWEILKVVGGVIAWIGKIAWKAFSFIGSIIYATVVKPLEFLGYLLYRIGRLGFKLLIVSVMLTAKMFMWLGQVAWKMVQVIWEGIKWAADKIWGVLKWVGQLFESIFNWIYETAVKPVVDAIVEVFLAAWDVIKPYWEVAKEVFSEIWNFVKDLTIGVWNEIKREVSAAWEFIKSVWEPVKNFFSVIFTTLWEAAKASVNKIIGFFDDLIGGVKKAFDFIENGIDALFGHSIHTVVEEDLGKAMEVFTKLKELALQVFDKIEAVAKQVLGFIGDLWRKLQDQVQIILNFVQNLVNTVFDRIQVIVSGVLAAVSVLWDKFKDGVVEILNKIQETVLVVSGEIQKLMVNPLEEIRKGWEFLKGEMTRIIGDVKQAISDDIAAVINVFENAKKKICELFGGIWDKAVSIFGHSINTLVGKDMEKTVGVMKEASDQIVSYLQEGLEKAIVEAFPKAFTEAFKKTRAATELFTRSELELHERFLKDLKDKWLKKWSEIQTGTSTVMDTLSGKIVGIQQQMLALSHVYEGLKVKQAEYNEKKKEAADDAEAASKSKGAPLSVEPTERLIYAVNHPSWYAEGVSGRLGSMEKQITNSLDGLTKVLGVLARLPAPAAGGKGGAGSPTAPKNAPVENPY